MKKILIASLFSAFLILTFTSPGYAQSYKEFVGENTNAERDLKMVGDFINALTAGDLTVAKGFLADNYKGMGPSPKDSANRDQLIASWTENNRMQQNRKSSFVAQTFRVLQGDQKGDWVSVWGDYSFSQNGKSVTFPYQYTAHINNGKIDRDIIYYDRAYVLESLGYKIVPPAE